MRFNRVVAALLSLAVLAGAGACGGDDDGDEDTNVTTETTTGGEKTEGTAVTLKAALSGAEEVPGPGADPAVGAAVVEVSGNQVCPDLNVTMAEKPTAAHIHRGAKGAAGPVVINLEPEFTAGESAFTAPRKCVEAPADVVAALLANPTAYYLNVHSASFPNGAVRGQLDKF